MATVTGTGALTATVIIEISLDNVTFDSEASSTITLSGTTSASDGCVLYAPWKFIRARLSAISGTNARVDVLMGT